MQHLSISSRQAQLKTHEQFNNSLKLRDSSDHDNGAQNFSISVLEWLNAELRKEAEKQEIVAFDSHGNIMDRLQNMLSTKATGITIMVVGFFFM
ncbi:hypothetical protein [uncultured Gimesia sp.]|uniref:hypothetical protein n=1 Tax=uncultured Gimesia sp. TaxID=1678688 RepID=UPI002628FCFA|nr:hypothetical protein [uncultured Gimesia sp.]